MGEDPGLGSGRARPLAAPLARPDGLAASAVRDLPASSGAGERLHVDFIAPRLVGFALSYWLGRLRIARAMAGRVTVAVLDDLLFFCVLGVVLGGRLGYVLFYKPAYYFSHPLEVFAVWHGGMSFHGGFLGVLLAIGWVARKHGLRWIEVTDFFAPLAPLAFAAVRLGNFINGELYGRVTDVPWGMVFRGGGALPQ